jgi:hypothetical protein
MRTPHGRPRLYPLRPLGLARVLGPWGLFTDVVDAGKRQLDLAELVSGRVLLGSPEECAAELRPLLDAGGFTRLVCRVQWMGMDQRFVVRTIAILPSPFTLAALEPRVALFVERAQPFGAVLRREESLISNASAASRGIEHRFWPPHVPGLRMLLQPAKGRRRDPRTNSPSRAG